MQLSLSNVINISVSTPQPGVGQYNTSNLVIFTSEVYAESFGDDGYKIYIEPTEVATDFGTDSKVYDMALAIFSQQPNILLNGGYLVVIPFIPEVQTLSFSGTPVSGVFKLNFGGDITAAINYDDTASEIQTAVRTLTGLEDAVVTGSIPAGVSISFDGYYGNAALMTVSDNTMVTSAPVAVTVTVAQGTAGETLAAAITRTSGVVQYFGILTTETLESADVLAAAAVVQALVKLMVFVTPTEADVETGGLVDDVRSGGFTKTRCLFYGSTTDNMHLIFAAAYAGRGFSTVFSGSNTTQTMHLKTLSGVLPDESMTQTLLQKCQDAGADVYISLQGVSKTFTSGANRFFDQIFNECWFVGALQVAGFNALAQSDTKVPQTENGMNILKSAYRAVCRQGITNQYGAPGTWTSPTTFGNQADLYLNISQFGFYVYSAPISQQLPADREDRIAPLVQIAFKEAGAIHKSNVVVYVNP